MVEHAIEVHSLTKRFGNLIAVDQVSFKVKRGTTFGFLGPNGAGKTTIIKMLTCLLRPDSGMVLVAGNDVLEEPMAVRRSIGYVAESPGFYERMTANETLDYFSQLFGISLKKRQKRIDKLLDWVSLTDRKDKYVGTFSKGMKRRLALAQALLSEPEVLILDEPTLGLDPMGTKEIREMIISLKKTHNMTIFTSSHILPEVEAVCDEVGIIHHGRLLVQDSVENLRRATGRGMRLEIVLTQADNQIVTTLQNMSCIQGIEVKDRQLMISTIGKDEVRPQIIDTLVKSGAQILSFAPKEANLEEILLRVVGEQVSDSNYA